MRAVRSDPRRDPADAARRVPAIRPISPTRSGSRARSCPTTWPACAAAGWWSPNPRAGAVAIELADERIAQCPRRSDRAGADRRPGVLPRRRQPTTAADDAPSRPARADATDAADPPAGGRDDHLQRRRGGRRPHRGHAGLVVGADRVRPRLGRSRCRRRPPSPGSSPPRTRRPGRRPHCGSSRSRSSRWRPTSPSTRCCRCSGVGEARPSLIGIALAAASLVVMPVLSSGAAPSRPRIRLIVGCCRFQADAALYLSVGGPAGRPGAQRTPRLVVGRPGRRVGHRRGGNSRGPKRLAR